MPTYIAAVNTPELAFMGLARVAEASSEFEIDLTDDPLRWASKFPSSAMLVGVRVDADIALIEKLSSEEPRLTVVALLDHMSSDLLLRCVAAGAKACVTIDWSGDQVLMALAAGVNDTTTLPAPMAREWATSQLRRSGLDQLTQSQQSWLRALASGMSVHDLAEEIGFSERETYRRLRKVYLAMGVRGRTEALIKASAAGIL